MRRLGHLGIWVLSALIVIAIGRDAARLTWSLAGQTGLPVTDIATALAEPQRKTPLDLTPILALAPFGTQAVIASADPIARETSLGLALRGVVVAAPENSIAVISSDGGEAKLYGVGDSIESKAILQEVLTDKVMLQIGDRVETLSFAKPEANSGVAGIVAGITNSGVETTSSIPKPGTPMLEEFRRKVAQNPQTVLDSVGISASANGYTVDQDATSIVSRAGLRPGDLISKVNGEPVGDIERDRQLFDKIIASGQVRIELVRTGRTVFMSFPLK